MNNPDETTHQTPRLSTFLEQWQAAKIETTEAVANLATRLLGGAQKDTDRLNWIEEQNACLRFDAEDDASLPQAVVFLPTLANGESTFRAAGHGDTFRQAIDAAIARCEGKVT